MLLSDKRILGREMYWLSGMGESQKDRSHFQTW